MRNRRVFIIDDERLAREELKIQLQQLERIELVGEASSGEEAKRMIQSIEPDVLLVDIQMPGKNGIDFVKELDNPPYVVFVSAHVLHEISSFAFGSFDYFLKPVHPARLKETLERI